MAGLGTCMILGALIWTKPLRRLKGWTIADYYGLRYASKKLGAYSGTVLTVAFGVFNAGALTVGGTYILQTIFDIPFIPAAIIFVGITAIYSIIGGLWAVAYTEVVQGLLAVIGILGVTFAVIFNYQEAIFQPDWWNVGELFEKGGATFWGLYLVLALGDIPAADLGQRVAGAKSPKVAYRSMIVAGIVIVSISWIPGMLGEAFKTIYPNHPNPEMLMLVFTEGYFPPFVSAIFLTALGAMGMSTLAACLVASSGVFTKNIYIDFFKQQPQPTKLLRVSRVAIAGSALLGLILAINFQQVIDLAYLAWDVIFVTVFWPLVLGPFWRRVSTPAVWLSITVGLVYYIVTSVWGVPGFANVANQGFIGLLAELWQMPVMSGVVLSGITIVAFSYIFPASPQVQAVFEKQKDRSLDD